MQPAPHTLLKELLKGEQISMTLTTHPKVVPLTLKDMVLGRIEKKFGTNLKNIKFIFIFDKY